MDIFLAWISVYAWSRQRRRLLEHSSENVIDVAMYGLLSIVRSWLIINIVIIFHELFSFRKQDVWAPYLFNSPGSAQHFML
jgi:hypothetical protein